MSAMANPPDSISVIVTIGRICTTEGKTVTSKRGKMIILPTCCAARISFTLEDMIMLASTLRTQARGITIAVTKAQYIVGKSNVPKLIIDQPSMTMTNISSPMYVAPMQGINAPRLLPKSNSPSVVGVASKGSRLFSSFSPMKL
jgi:hypothetical protein